MRKQMNAWRIFAFIIIGVILLTGVRAAVTSGNINTVQVNAAQTVSTQIGWFGYIPGMVLVRFLIGFLSVFIGLDILFGKTIASWLEKSLLVTRRANISSNYNSRGQQTWWKKTKAFILYPIKKLYKGAEGKKKNSRSDIEEAGSKIADEAAKKKEEFIGKILSILKAFPKLQSFVLKVMTKVPLYLFLLLLDILYTLLFSKSLLLGLLVAILAWFVVFRTKQSLIWIFRLGVLWAIFRLSIYPIIENYVITPGFSMPGTMFGIIEAVAIILVGWYIFDVIIQIIYFWNKFRRNKDKKISRRLKGAAHALVELTTQAPYLEKLNSPEFQEDLKKSKELLENRSVISQDLKTMINAYTEAPQLVKNTKNALVNVDQTKTIPQWIRDELERTVKTDKEIEDILKAINVLRYDALKHQLGGEGNED